MRTPALLLIALALVAAACTRPDSASTEPSTDASTVTTTPRADETSFAGTEAAPEFPDGLDWLNTGGRELRLADLKGKVVVLDFWTYGCINCIHIIPDLKRLEAEFADELVVIGVHSAKFTTEAGTDNIRQIILRYDLEHPVVNDRDFETWRQWGARAWPTIAVVDPAGNVVGTRSGEGVYDAIQPVIASLVDEFASDIDSSPLPIRLESEGLPQTILSFPGKVTVAAAEIFIADTNNHRIVRASLPDGEVTAVYGDGVPGFASGSGLEARFDQPQGMALDEANGLLYVADTGNHAIRVIDLDTGEVTVALGTGAQGGYPPTGGLAPVVPIRSPWDVLLDGTDLYIAMAGSHQIWKLDLATGLAGPFAGSGAESDKDGAAAEAELAQPSGLALGAGGILYFADSESSSIRLTDNGRVDTVVGAENGLFEFGDVDGTATDVRLQHPLGVAWTGDALVVADTYNSKLKLVDPTTRNATTLLGGDPGFRDGPDALFYEPGGVAVSGSTVYVADTNNHVIRIVDLEGLGTTTLILKGIERFTPPADQEEYRGTIVELGDVEVGAGPGSIVLDITLPPDHKVNEDAPSSVEWSVAGGVATFPEPVLDVTGTDLPIVIPVEFTEGSGRVTGDVTLVWCAADAESLCFIEQLRVGVGLTVADSGPSEIRVPYRIELPEL
jgi:thiol-disulfide isomerase/thioredoxin/sugar lactone lactonase YvrE